MNVTLTTTEVAQLTAQITGGGFKRSATKADAIARFKKVAAERGINSVEEILAAATAQEASAHLASSLKLLAEVPAPAADPHAASNTLIANAVARDPELAALASGKGGPGLARLRAKAEAETIRQSTNDEADAARAAVREQQEALKIAGKDRRTGIDALATELAPKAKAPKAAKVKPEGTGTRTKTETGATITAVVANPKKPGSRAFAAFEHYKAGQTVAEFFASCVAAGIPESEAKANLSWDRRKGFITVSAGA